VQPFSPILIVLLLGVGLALGVFAFVHQPGPSFALMGRGNNTAQVLEPMKLNDTANLKLFNN
jgi:hypothetical protein